LSQAQWSHIDPYVADIRKTFLFASLLSDLGPTRWNGTIVAPDRILFLVIDNDRVGASVRLIFHRFPPVLEIALPA
jgi:hypothetical protein